MLAAWSMTTFAVDAEVLPRSVVAIMFQIEILLLATHMARVARFVPYLDVWTRRFFGILNVEIMDPRLSHNVPCSGQNGDSAVGECSEIVLHAPASKRETH